MYMTETLLNLTLNPFFCTFSTNSKYILNKITLLVFMLWFSVYVLKEIITKNIDA